MNMMINEKEMSKQLSDISINSRLMIINGVGLTKKSKEILIAKYIDELSINEMCDKFNYEERTIKSRISKAKKELNKIINREYRLMDEKLREYIRLLILNDEE